MPVLTARPICDDFLEWNEQEGHSGFKSHFHYPGAFVTKMIESFFFFIGGIQPKTILLDETPRRCPRCGLHQAYLQRVDHYLSVFFIPVLKVKTGAPLLVCHRCERPVDGSGPASSGPQSETPATRPCRFCHRDFPADYAFCPLCGRRL